MGLPNHTKLVVHRDAMTDTGRGRESEGDRRVSLLYLLKALAQGSLQEMGDSDKGDWEGVREWVSVREATPGCSQTEQTPNSTRG